MPKPIALLTETALSQLCSSSSGGAVACGSTKCCSSWGTCGTSFEHCANHLLCTGSACLSLELPPLNLNPLPPPVTSTTVKPTPTDPVTDPNKPRKIYETCVTPGHIALTFDDGPTEIGDRTQKVLEKLASRIPPIKATFFVNGCNGCSGAQLGVGMNAQKRALLQAIKAAGHQIACHTYTHADMIASTHAQRNVQLDLNDALFKEVVGLSPRYFRPPFGNTNDAVWDSMDARGYYMVKWNLDSNDWKFATPDGATAIDDIVECEECERLNVKTFFSSELAKLNPSTQSSIALFHDTGAATEKHLAWYLEEILAKGFTPVLLDECLNGPEKTQAEMLIPPYRPIV